MAEEGDKSSSPQNLMCPLCLGVFEDATLLTCGHTFCRKCLKKYDASHQDLDHMVCPLCRKVTQFPENRVEGLPANVTVNGLVDENHSIRGGVNAVLELRPKCTACESQGEAVSFCSTCNNYMCDHCHHGHLQLTSFFKGHQVVSIQDVMGGKVSIAQLPEKCSVHKHENKDLFCEDCKVHICFKCVIVCHRDHKIKNQHDFEMELREKVAALIQHCKAKKTELEKNIQNTEAQRQGVDTAFQKLEAEVRKAYDTKAKQLKENERFLLEEIQSLQRRFHDDLDALKVRDRQMIKSITSTATLVTNDRLGHLETDSLAAHTLLCDELDGLLKEVTDKTSAVDISEVVQDKEFLAADEALLDIGEVPKCSLRVVKEVDVPEGIYGITKKSKDSVYVALSGNRRIEVVNCSGNRDTLNTLPAQGYFDISIQDNGTIVVSFANQPALINTHLIDGSKISTIHINSIYCPSVSVSHSEEIIVANGNNEINIYVYAPTGNKLKHTVPTKNNRPRQALVTRSGVIITSSCYSTPSVLSVYDRDGQAGSSLTANQGEYLYAAADEQDRVYVASVNPKSGKVLITLYKLEHLNLREQYRFEEHKCVFYSSFQYLVSLSRNMLALSTGKKIYFFKVYA